MVEPVRILARTSRYAVIHKPSGVLSVPGKGPDKQASVVSFLREHIPEARGPMVVHRLDMDTSGVMVYALDEAAQRDLSWAFESRQVVKRYVALVQGVLPAETGTVEAAMRLDPGRRPYQVVDPVQGRPALTRWRVVAFETDRTRVVLEPHTGRTHQLRVHMAHLGHPILGDVLYGPADADVVPRLMLHAEWLEFPDPSGGGPVGFHSRAEF